jgi:preprotein translocase subunit YajC
VAPFFLPLAEGQPQGSLEGLLFPLAIVALIFYFLVIRPGGREKKQREALLKGLKKHDRVVTNAGIHGVVAALEGDDVVVLKVDDKSNVRIRFARSAIWQVLQPEEGAGKVPERLEPGEGT